jgi:hypothetical protein
MTKEEILDYLSNVRSRLISGVFFRNPDDEDGAYDENTDLIFNEDFLKKLAELRIVFQYNDRHSGGDAFYNSYEFENNYLPTVTNLWENFFYFGDNGEACTCTLREFYDKNQEEIFQKFVERNLEFPKYI